jgi:hypothetical protein
MQWITQHDDCPLCRNPISDTPTINDDDEENNHDPIYIIYINEQTLSEKEQEEVNDRVNDFIDTFNEPLSIYKWKESNDGTWYTTIRKKKYYIDMNINIVNFENPYFQNYYKIYVGLHKRIFIDSNQYRKKHFKLNKLRNSSYLFK